MSFLDLFRPAPYKEEIADEEVVKKSYKYWRMRIFYGMYVGYIFYYFTRKSFTFAMPALIQDLGFDKAQLGILASILSITYGISKFLSGILADKSNPRYFMATGLILTGFLNIFFGLSSSLFFFALFWGLNGWFQGWGWPPCARLLTHWYSQKERGSWWGVWNSSHSVGGALIPLLAAGCAEYYGWRYAMYVPGVLCIAVGLFVINRLRDTPQSLGLPPIEKFRDDYPSAKHEQEKELPLKEILFKYVLSNKYIWLLAASYFFVYIIRTGINDWTVLYLVETKGYSLLTAGACVFWFEIGGIFGSLVAGFASDRIFKGKRGPINVLFSFLVIFAVAALWFSPPGMLVLDFLIMFGIGFLIFGPQMLIGMAAAELSHKKAAGSATGFVGWIAYLGAATAGYPLGKMTQEFGWLGFFIVLAACGAISVALLLPLWSVKTHPNFSSDEDGKDKKSSPAIENAPEEG
ncbi:MAG: MFS transporter [Chlamydiales bacterium]|nr:MFS transporter [Chlamydiales bacterium]